MMEIIIRPMYFYTELQMTGMRFWLQLSTRDATSEWHELRAKACEYEHCKKRVFRNHKSGGHPPATTFGASKHLNLSVSHRDVISIWRCYAVLDWVFGNTWSRLERCYVSLDLVFWDTAWPTVVLRSLEMSVSKYQ